jgi:hypothetical protein
MMGTTEAIFSMVSRLNERGGRFNVRQDPWDDKYLG